MGREYWGAGTMLALALCVMGAADAQTTLEVTHSRINTSFHEPTLEITFSRDVAIKDSSKIKISDNLERNPLTLQASKTDESADARIVTVSLTAAERTNILGKLGPWHVELDAGAVTHGSPAADNAKIAWRDVDSSVPRMAINPVPRTDATDIITPILGKGQQMRMSTALSGDHMVFTFTVDDSGLATGDGVTVVPHFFLINGPATTGGQYRDQDVVAHRTPATRTILATSPAVQDQAEMGTPGGGLVVPSGYAALTFRLPVSVIDGLDFGSSKTADVRLELHPYQGTYDASFYAHLFIGNDLERPEFHDTTTQKLDAGTGVLTLAFKEKVSVADLSKMFISETGASDQIPLTGAGIADNGEATVKITLTEDQRQQVLALTTPELDLAAASVSAYGETINMPIAAVADTALVVTADGTAPDLEKTVLDVESGKVSFWFDERVAAADLDLSKITVTDADGNDGVALSGASKSRRGNVVDVTLTAAQRGSVADHEKLPRELDFDAGAWQDAKSNASAAQSDVAVDHSGRPHPASEASEGYLYLKAATGLATYSIESGDDAGTYAVAAGYEGDGIQIIDVTDPELPSPRGSMYQRPHGTSDVFLDGPQHVETFEADVGGTDRVFAAVVVQNGISIIDVTDPDDPQAVEEIKDGKNGFTTLQGASYIDVFRQGTHIYGIVAASGDNGVQVIDLTNPASAVAVSSLADTGSTMLERPKEVSAFVISGKTYAAVTSRDKPGNDDGLQILDLTDPSRPGPVSQVRNTPGALLNFALAVETVKMGDKTYAVATSKDDKGITIVDVSDPRRPSITSSIPTGTGNPWTLDVFKAGPHVYAAVSLRGANALVFIDITDPSSPFEAGRTSVKTPAHASAFGGYLAVASAGDSAVKMVRAGDMSPPALAATVLDLSSSPGSVTLVFDETVDASFFDASKISISGTALSGSLSSDAASITLQLTSAQHTAISGVSDKTISAPAGAWQDLSGNRNEALSSVPVSHTAPGPSLSTASLDLDTNPGTLSLAFGSSVDVSETEPSRIRVTASDGHGAVALSKAPVNQDGQAITIQLTEAERSAIAALGAGRELDIDEGAWKASDGTPNAPAYDVQVTETEDTTKPRQMLTQLDKLNGIITIGFTEHIDAVPHSHVDLSKIKIKQHQGQTSRTLAGSSVLTASDGDMLTIRLAGDVAKFAADLSNPRIIIEAGAVRDVSGNGIALAQGLFPEITGAAASPAALSQAGSVFVTLAHVAGQGNPTSLDTFEITSNGVTKDYAAVIDTRGRTHSAPITIVDLSNPASPSQTDSTNIPVDFGDLNDVKTFVQGGKTYAAVLVDGHQNIQVTDISDPASLSQKTTRYSAGVRYVENRNLSLLEEGSRVFGVTVFGKELRMYEFVAGVPQAQVAADISDLVGLVDPERVKTVKVGGEWYVLIAAPGVMHVVKITVPASGDPTFDLDVLPGGIADGAAGFDYVADVKQIDTFVSDGSTYAVAASNDGAQIMDITDPASPAPAAGVTDGFRFPGFVQLRSVEVIGSYAVFANNTGSLLVMDISDPSDPEHTATIALNTRSGPFRQLATFETGGSDYVAVGGIFTDNLYTAKITDTTRPRLASWGYDAGKAVMTFTEAVASPDLSKMTIRSPATEGLGVGQVLTGATTALSADKTVLTVTLTSAQKTAVDAKSGRALDLGAAAVADAAGNTLLQRAQAAEEIRPAIESARITGPNQVTIKYDKAVTASGSPYTVTVSTARTISASSGLTTDTHVLTFSGAAAAKDATGTISIDQTKVGDGILTLGSNASYSQALADGQAPALALVSGDPSHIDEGTGVLTIKFDETVSYSETDLARFHIRDGAGQSSGGVTLSGAPSGTDADSFTVTVPPAALASVTAMDDPHLYVDAVGVADPSGNTMAPASEDLGQTPDTTAPSVKSASLDEGTGVMTVVFTEFVDVSEAVPASFDIREAGASSGGVEMSALNLQTEADSDALRFQLTEAQRQSVISMTTPELDLAAGAVRDLARNAQNTLAQNTSAAADDTAITATADDDQPQMVSARYVSDTQIEVTFSETVTATGTLTTGWSVREDTNLPSVFSVSAVSVSGAAATLTVASLGSANDFVVTYTDGPIEDTSGNLLAAGSRAFERVTDAPTVASAKAVSLREIEVTFSEPVRLASGTAPTGWTVSGAGKGTATAASAVSGISAGIAAAKATLTLDGSLASTNPSITLAYSGGNIEDVADNAMQNRASIPVSDGIAPTVSSTKVTMRNQIEVTFSEPVKLGPTLGSAPFGWTIGGADAVSLTVSRLDEISSSSVTSTATLNLSGSIADKTNPAVTAAYSSGNIVDAEGNALDDYAAAASEDGIAPKVSSARATALDRITVTFSEPVKDSSPTSGTGGWTISGTDSASRTITSRSDISTASNTLVLELDGDLADTAPDISLAYAPGTITDGASNALATATGISVSDGIAPAISSADAKSKTSITVTFTEDVSPSAPNTDGWLVHETADQSETYAVSGISVSGSVATLTVADIGATAPAVTVAYSSGGNIVDTASNALATSSAVPSDSIKPEIESAEAASRTSVEVTFTEDIAPSSPSATGWSVHLTADSNTTYSVSGVSVSGKVATLTVADLGTTAPAVTAAYSGNDMQDSSSNSLDSDTVNASDGIAPTVWGRIAGGAVTWTFSEDVVISSPPDTFGATTIDGADRKLGVSHSGDTVTVTLQTSGWTGPGPSATGSAQIRLSDIADAAGNAMTPTPGFTSLPADDGTAPSISGATATSPTTIRVTFDEPVATSDTTGQGWSISGADASSLTVDSSTALDGSTVDLTISGALADSAPDAVLRYETSGSDVGSDAGSGSGQIKDKASSARATNSLIAQYLTYPDAPVSNSLAARQSIQVGDGLAPSVESARTASLRSVEVAFSEPVMLSSAGTAPFGWTISGTGANSAEVQSISGPGTSTSASTATLVLDRDLSGTDAQISVAYSGGNIADGDGNALAAYAAASASDGIGPAVSSAKAVSRNQVQVEFSEPVKLSSGSAPTGWTVSGADKGAATGASSVTGMTASVAVSSATLTLNGQLADKTLLDFTLAYSGGNAVDAAGNQLSGYSAKPSDGIAPRIEAAESRTSSTLTVIFSEPVSGTATAASTTWVLGGADSQGRAVSTNPAITSAGSTTLGLDGALGDPIGTVTLSYASSVGDIADASGNALADQQVSATQDLAPRLSSAKAVSRTQIELTFSEQVRLASGTAPTGWTVSGTDAGTATGAASISGITATSAASAATLILDGSLADTTSPSVTISYSGGNLEDVTDNAMADIASMSVSDGIAPRIESARAVDTTTVEVTFTEDVEPASPNADGWSVSLTADPSTTYAVSGISVSNKVATLAVADLRTTSPAVTVEYTTGGNIVDTSSNPLASGTAPVSDAIAPRIESAEAIELDQIRLTFSEPVLLAPGASPSDWQVSGPGAGTATAASAVSGLTETAAASEAVLTLDGSLAGTSPEVTLSYSGGIVDAAANAAAAVPSMAVSDGISPTVSSARAVSVTQVEISFSEPVRLASGTAPSGWSVSGPGAGTASGAASVSDITQAAIRDRATLTLDGSLAGTSPDFTLSYSEGNIEDAFDNALAGYSASPSDGISPVLLSGSLQGTSSFLVRYSEPVTSMASDYAVLSSGTSTVPAESVSGSGNSIILVRLSSSSATFAAGDEIRFTAGAGVVDLSSNTLSNPGQFSIPASETASGRLVLVGGGRLVLPITEDTLVSSVDAQRGTSVDLDISSLTDVRIAHERVTAAGGDTAVFPRDIAVSVSSGTVTFRQGLQAGGLADGERVTVAADPAVQLPPGFAASIGLDASRAATVLELGRADGTISFSEPVRIDLAEPLSDIVYVIRSDGPRQVLSCGAPAGTPVEAQAAIDALAGGPASDSQACFSDDRTIWTLSFSTWGSGPPAPAVPVTPAPEPVAPAEPRVRGGGGGGGGGGSVRGPLAAPGPSESVYVGRVSWDCRAGSVEVLAGPDVDGLYVTVTSSVLGSMQASEDISARGQEDMRLFTAPMSPDEDFMQVTAVHISAREFLSDRQQVNVGQCSGSEVFWTPQAAAQQEQQDAVEDVQDEEPPAREEPPAPPTETREAPTSPPTPATGGSDVAVDPGKPDVMIEPDGQTLLPECGPGTELSPAGECVVASTTAPEGQNGCLVATAAYGTELAPAVQRLREVRDGTLQGTAAGSAFMSAFNAAYYAFSPAVADLERQSPAFRDAVRAAVTPMIYSLQVMDSASSEGEVAFYGLAVIALNLAMYAGAPAAAVVYARRRVARGRRP